MARLVTSGFEVQIGSTTSQINGEAEVGGSGVGSLIQGSPTFDTTNQRSGRACLSCAAASTYHRWTPTFVLDRTYYIRAYFRFGGLPVSNTCFPLTVSMNGVAVAQARINTSSFPVLNDASGILFTGGTALAAGNWYRFDMEVMIPTAGSGVVGLWVDGRLIGRSTTATVNNSVTTPLVNIGWTTAAVPGQTILVDDVAINDNQGTQQSGFPGPGKVILLKPISHSAIGNFEGPQTTGSDITNLNDNVDNTPPLGVAHSDADANANKYAFNANATVPNNFDLNCETYTTGGVRAVDWINVAQAVVRASTNSTTGVNNAAIQLVSNPADAGTTTVDLEINAIAGTEPAGWKTFRTPVIYDPTVTIGTSPVVRFQKTLNSTNAHMVDLMGVLVEYWPSAFVFEPLEFRYRHLVSR